MNSYREKRDINEYLKLRFNGIDSIVARKIVTGQINSFTQFRTT